MTSHPSQFISSTTITVQAEAALDPYRFNMFMADLLAEHGKQITHMAGTLNIQVGLHTCANSSVSLLPSKYGCLCSHSLSMGHVTYKLFTFSVSSAYGDCCLKLNM